VRPINAGNYRHKITFQQALPSTDTVEPNGERLAGWVDYWTTWASIEPIMGRELATLRSQGGLETHRVRCRYYPGLNVTMQIRYANPVNPVDAFDDGFSDGFAGGGGDAAPDRLFRITSVLNVEERNYDMEIMATETLHP
jgi:SPP1 family predicted phage head-tail adaptor